MTQKQFRSAQPSTQERVLTNWVFLRGLVRESAHWDDFPDIFRAAIPGARVHLIDLPGNGQHWRLPSPLSLRETMEAVRAEALAAMQAQCRSDTALTYTTNSKHVRGDGLLPYYLLTISLGSMVAVEWANRHSDELAGAVLINTSLRGLSPLHQRLSLRAWPLIAHIVAATDAAKRERLIFELTSSLPDPSARLIENRVATHRFHPVQLKNVFRQLWAAARYLPPLEKPPIPLLLLNSKGDRMVDPSCTQAMAQRWGIEPKIHPWAGHDLPLDDPEWVITAVLDWLERGLKHHDSSIPAEMTVF